MSTKKKGASQFAAFAQEPLKGSILGGFSATPFITTDADPDKTDTYITNEPIPSRHLGKNFTTTPVKHGQTPDVYLGRQYLTLASPSQAPPEPTEKQKRRQEKHEKKAAEAFEKSRIQKEHFKYSHPAKEAMGLGSYFGTFQARPFDHQADYTVPARDSVREPVKPPVVAPRNFVTNAGKKGTFGFPNTTFTKIPYLSDHDFEGKRKREGDAWAAEKARQQAEMKRTQEEKRCKGGVWKLTLNSKKTFDEKAATGISSIYDPSEPKEEKKKRRTKKRSKKEPAQLVQPVFKYASAPKAGLYGFFDPKWLERPEGMADPFGDFTAAERARIREEEEAKQPRRKKKAAKPKKGAWVAPGLWKPPTGAKSSVVRSLLRRFY